MVVLKKSNFEVKHRLDELIELMKKGLLNKAQTMEGSSIPYSKMGDSSTMVSSQPQTPTHIVTINSPVNSGVMSDVRSINWGIQHTPIHTMSTIINPSTTAVFNLTPDQLRTYKAYNQTI